MAKEAVNTLFLISDLRRAGAETQLVDLINGLDTRSFNKYLFTYEPMLDQADRLNMQEITHIHAQRRQGTKVDLLVVKALAALIDAASIEVVHCTFQYSLLLALMTRRYSRRRPILVVALHTTISLNLKDELQNQLLYRWLFLQAARVIFVCNKQADYWCRRYRWLKTRKRVVHNGVDPDYFSTNSKFKAGLMLKKSLDIPAQGIIVSCVACFRPEKGHKYLLEAFAKLDSNNTYLVLAGDGPTRNASEHKAIKLGIAQRVHFLGELKDVRPVLSMSTVSVIASTVVETFSMAMLESLSMKVPVIATDIGGMSEGVLPGKTGLLVYPRDVDGLARAISKLVDDSELASDMGRNGRQLVIENYTRRYMIEHTADVLAGAYSTAMTTAPG